MVDGWMEDLKLPSSKEYMLWWTFFLKIFANMTRKIQPLEHHMLSKITNSCFHRTSSNK